MFAVLRIRGGIKAKEKVLDTLKMLNLSRKMHCVMIQENPSMNGMIKKTKDYISWGSISDETLKKMIIKRGRKIGNKKLTAEEAESAFNDIKAGKKPSIKPVFRLSPPSKGFKKSVKQHYPRGEIGFRKDGMDKLLKRMI